MSLVNFAIRTCLKRALLDRTFAEGRVFDSMVTPIDHTIEAGALPMIVVSTDDDQATLSSFDLNVDGRELDVVIEMELASAVEVEAGGVNFEIPLTDAGLEATLDILHRQVLRALAEPTSEWANLFRRFVADPKKILKRRGASTEKGVRFAARQIVLTCQPANELPYGADPKGAWADLILLMRADKELSDLAALVAAELTGAPLPSWRVIQAGLGYTDAQIRALGPTPLDPAEAGEAPVMTEAVLFEIDKAGVVSRSTAIAAGTLASFEPIA